MIRVITYGTFDLLHPGHINLLSKAAAMGDYLIVGLSTDNFNDNIKKKHKTFYSYEDRKMMLESLRYVDEVIPEDSWEQKEDDILNHNVDVFVMGDDWKGAFDYLRKDGVEVVYFPRTPGISTSEIREFYSSGK